jgi:putative addiction module component (TIGR02574 family)
VALTYDQILAEALKLPAEEQERLVDYLSSSLDSSELSPEWRAELTRRIERIERGQAKTVSWEEVRAEAETILRRG